MCFSGGANVREIVDLTIGSDPLPDLLAHFEPRLEAARSRGVDRIIIDPGMGFFYGNLTDPLTRARHQATVLLQCFRLRPLGVPVCNALPHAFDLFEEHFRTAEGFYAVLAMLGGTDLLRTHEVAQVRAVVTAMRALSI
jgi:dihydropteroate synthase